MNQRLWQEEAAKSFSKDASVSTAGRAFSFVFISLFFSLRCTVHEKQMSDSHKPPADLNGRFVAPTARTKALPVVSSPWSRRRFADCNHAVISPAARSSVGKNQTSALKSVLPSPGVKDMFVIAANRGAALAQLDSRWALFQTRQEKVEREFQNAAHRKIC